MKIKKASHRLKAWRSGRDNRLPGRWWQIACKRGWVGMHDCFQLTAQETAEFWAANGTYASRDRH